MADRKKVPLGQPINWTEAELDTLSTITEADIIKAGEWWKQNAPKKFKRLLEAEPDYAATNTGK